MAYLDDQNGRPAQQKFLDLSSLKPQTKEEVQSALYRLPEMKLRPEKISDEDVVSLESWKNIRDFPYLNPVPGSMLHVDIRELSKVDIDWKMLTLDRPETILEIHIFSRIVFLNKVTRKCVAREKVRKERAQSIRLRMSGRFKIVQENDSDKLEEFTYEFYSRQFGVNDRGQAMEEIPKPPPAEEPKAPQPTADDAQSNDAVAKDGKAGSKKKKIRKKKLAKKRKNVKKCKVRKRKTTNVKKGLSCVKKGSRSLSSVPKTSLHKSKKVGQVKKQNPKGLKSSRRKPDVSGKTLIQMLKVSEKSAVKQAKEKSQVTGFKK